MTPQIPVTVVGGYLGAGKTTLVNHVLREANGLRIAVLVNDFGALAIDADLIEAREGGLISIAGGCICCSFGSDLIGALAELARRLPRPDHVLIETSGVALPGGVARSAALIADFSIDSVVVLADAETVRERAGDKFMGDTVTRQLREADLVLVNKADLVTASEVGGLRAWIALEAPQARQIEAVRAHVPVDLVFGFGQSRPAVRDAGALYSGAMPTVGDAATNYESASFSQNVPIDVQRLARGLARKESGLIRAKGVLLDIDGTMKTLHLVGARWEVARFAGLLQAGTGLVCIGLSGRFDRVRIERALAGATPTVRVDLL